MSSSRATSSTRRRDLRGRAAAHAESEAEIAANGHVRVERVALEDHRHAALLRREAGDILVVEPHASRARGFEAGDEPQRRGLAAARRPDQHEKFAVGDGEIQVA